MLKITDCHPNFWIRLILIVDDSKITVYVSTLNLYWVNYRLDTLGFVRESRMHLNNEFLENTCLHTEINKNYFVIRNIKERNIFKSQIYQIKACHFAWNFSMWANFSPPDLYVVNNRLFKSKLAFWRPQKISI